MLGCQSGVVAIVYYNCCSECSNEYSESVILTLQLSLRTHTYTLFPSHAQQGNVVTHVHAEWHLHTCICKHFYWVFKSGDTGTSSRICTLASTSRKDAGRRYLSGTFSSPLFFLMASAKFSRAVWHLSGHPSLW